jgi:hypothetical protein
MYIHTYICAYICKTKTGYRFIVTVQGKRKHRCGPKSYKMLYMILRHSTTAISFLSTSRYVLHGKPDHEHNRLQHLQLQHWHCTVSRSVFYIKAEEYIFVICTRIHIFCAATLTALALQLMIVGSTTAPGKAWIE